MYVENQPPRRYRELDGKTFLICIGGMKCATSWVYGYLAGLPGVTVSPIKEMHFFDARFSANALGDMDLLAMKRLQLHLGRDGNPAENLRLSPEFQASVDRVQMIYNDDAYLAHFARIATPETRVLCDVTPAYSAIGPNGFAFMRDHFAEQKVQLKILYILRDPVDRLWSQLRHLQEINPEGRVAEQWQKAIRSPKIGARADYAGTLADLDMYFAAEDVLCLFYEDLFTDAALSRLCDFAGVAYRPADTETRANETRLKLDLPDAARAAFRDLLANQYTTCRARFGDRIPATWSA